MSGWEHQLKRGSFDVKGALNFDSGEAKCRHHS